LQDSARWLQRTEPESSVATWFLLQAHERQNDVNSAIEDRRQLNLRFGNDPKREQTDAMRLHADVARIGADAYWRARLDDFQNPEQSYERAVIEAHLGQVEQARVDLEKAAAGHSTQLLYWGPTEPALAGLWHSVTLPKALAEIGP
jgi:hypothetical protein